MYSVQRLPSGIPVLTSPIDGTAAVTILILAGAGSRYESQGERGISHFLEHMFFKGGKRYKSTKEVSTVLEGVGADFNAFTGKEYAGYYVKVAADHAELACDVLSDMLIHATFPQEEIEKERGVIMEEERMYQDTPMYRVGWDFEQLLFGDHPLGWDTIGTEEVIRSVNQADFVKHQRGLYVADNLVITFAGHIQDDTAASLAAQYFGSIEGKKDRAWNAFSTFGEKKLFLRTKNTEQAHLVLGVPGVSSQHEDHFVQKLLSVILGGNMSSRMFLRIREARGMCYYISTEVDSYLDAGSISTRAGVDQSRLHEAISAIKHEYLLAAKDGIEDEELHRAKEYLKGRVTLSMEDSEEIAHFLGKQMLLYPKVRDIPEYFRAIDVVTVEQVNALAKSVFTPEALRLVVIGKEDNEGKLQELLA